MPFFKKYKLHEITHALLGKGIKARSDGAPQTFNLDRETLHTLFQYAKKR